MSDSEFDHAESVDQSLDALTAAQLLGDAERVGVAVRAHTDFRAHAMIQGWTAAALFVYAATFLLLFGNPNDPGSTDGVGHNYSYVNVLLIPFFILMQLIQGARNRLPVSVTLPRRGITLLLVLPSMFFFLAAAAAALVGIDYPWWVTLLVATAIAAPLGLLAISTARKAGGLASHVQPLSPRSPLGRTAAGMTAGMGAYFGVVAAVTPYPWFPVAALILTLALFVALIGWNARWGLPSIGSRNGRPIYHRRRPCRWRSRA